VVACINFTLGKVYEKSNAQVAAAYFKKAEEGGINADKYLFKRNHPYTGKMIEAAFKNLN
jgi:hypothetical protein